MLSIEEYTHMINHDFDKFAKIISSMSKEDKTTIMYEYAQHILTAGTSAQMAHENRMTAIRLGLIEIVK